MEQRKVQVTGGSTYTVSIPKSWANQNDIEAGSEIVFFPDKDTLLMASPSKDAKTEGTLDIGEMEGESLKRAVMTMYVS
ncbi:MAG: AbrB/MazE/SpoVT family DNA-binding domain-containing protein, partial [Halobacteriaceae archaeon]